MKKIIVISVFLELILAQSSLQLCGTAPMPPEQVFQIKRIVEQWVSDQDRDDPEPVHILVAWHVIHTSTGAGNISDDAIYSSIDWLNQTFQPHFIAFVLDSIDRTENEDWFNNWYGSQAWPGMQQLNVDPHHYLNIYSANLYEVGVAGWSYIPTGWLQAGDYRNSVNLDYREVGAGNDVNTHEVGHHLGLPHTFNTNCSGPDDGIDDTPRNHEDYLWECNDNLDSCPDDEGNDPVHNYMTYTTSACQYEFTQGQQDRMHTVINASHPGYLENNPLSPTLYLDQLIYEMDSDGDGILNPVNQSA